MGFYQTDGKSIKSLTVDDVFGSGIDLTHDITPRAAYASVPFVRRAVRLRANAVAGVPITLQKGEEDISKSKAFTALMTMLPGLIWKTEFALCLSTYGAYWRRAANARGLNPTPEWLLPSACWPYTTAERGLERVRYTHPWGVPSAGHVDMLALDEVVVFWLPNIERADWPGVPPGQTANNASNALTNKDTFTANYFRGGAIKGQLLQVPTNTSRDERDRLKSWWSSVVSGVRNAWKANVISTDVKPIAIGEGLGDIGEAGKELVSQYRQDIAAAFEVPESMLLSNAANFATASEERIGFYEETVFPALELILSSVNRQWLQPQYGVELVAHPEQTEPRQDAQVQQAQAITDLVGRPVLTVDEGRAWLGMEPMEHDIPDPANEAQDYQNMEQEAQADNQAEQDAEEPTTKALRGDIGHYRAYPGTQARTMERTSVWTAHAAQRRATQTRHADERTQTKARQIEERNAAPDAGTRLRLVRRHRAEIATLSARHTAERGMLRSLHTAERVRVRERHAAMRTGEEVLA